MKFLTRRSRARGGLAALGAVLVAVAPAALAQDRADRSQQLVATVDGSEIRQADISAFVATLPPQVQQLPPDQVFPLVLREIINTKILAKLARREELDKDPEFERQIRTASEQILRQVILERLSARVLTDAAIENYYNENIAAAGGEVEIRARHILLDSRDDAEEVLNELEGGGNFEQLARDRSTGPSGPAGGDLGYFTRDAMVPAFAEAAFNLEVGDVSQPVETRFGWHVIKLEDRRETAPPALEEVRDEISRQLFTEAVQTMIEEERASTEVVLYGSDGNPIEDDAQ